MKRVYKTTVQFVKQFAIEAKDASEANAKLEELVSEAEVAADLTCDGFEVFEDESVECPKCKGNGIIGEDEQQCDQCQGNGQVPFSATDSKQEAA